MVHSAGSFPATIAQQIGFVDYLPRKDPLDDLVLSNASVTSMINDDDSDDITSPTRTNKEKLQDKWGDETDFGQFRAEAKISITEYANWDKKERAKRDRERRNYQRFQKLGEMTGMHSLLELVGLSAAPNDSKQGPGAKGLDEKIAVLKIGGPITEATARKVEAALRKVKQDDKVKALVLRIDSPGGAITACETIHQELKDLPQKVVVSFGNVSASGGYYISANADRIFASPTTITGSIGVFMLRADLRGLAKQYGITFDSVSMSDMAGSYDAFFPINKRMEENFANYADRAYLRFKSLVGDGRGMEIDAVEKIAQGRVWTGTQAKEIGLVDELGGLDRAIAYAQRMYTTRGNAQVVEWPPKRTLLEYLMRRKHDDAETFEDVDVPYALQFLFANAMWMPLIGHFAAARGRSTGATSVATTKFPLMATGVMLAADENVAIRCLLEENGIPNLMPNCGPDFWA